jgi:pyruvate dehydrogenase E2 component (dihydrolipoamide acetyltransferase)
MSNDREVKVPDIGDFENVDVIDVMVGEGDSIEKDTPLITLETEKAALDVPAPFAGKIKTMKVKSGDKVSEGDVIMIVEAAAETEGKQEETQPEADKEKEEKKPEAPKPPAEEKKEKKAEQPPEQPRQPAARELPPIDEKAFSQAHASPSVRKFARELGVDLGRVSGSGRKNRITHDDVKAFVKQAIAGGGAGGGGLPALPRIDFSRFGEVERRPLSRIKKISGPHLQASWVNLPHVTQHDEADITDMEAVRKALKTDAEARGTKLTPLAFLVKACVSAMKEYPEFNASLDADGATLIYKKYFHIGFAVDTEGGLLVPVIRDADQKNLLDIAAELGELGEKARNGKLKADEMQGGCFSISSLGSIGGTYFTPIINAPEVAILGVSRSQMKPVWRDGKFEPRLMLPLSLSYDHRVIDGAMAARFTRYLADVLGSMKGLIY